MAEVHPLKERYYRFALRDIVAGVLNFISKGKDVDDALKNLARKLGEHPDSVAITMIDSQTRIWNPTRGSWVKQRPYWEEEKEEYEWEKLA